MLMEQKSSVATLHDILREKQPVTPAMALRLGKLCGNGPTYCGWRQRSLVDDGVVVGHLDMEPAFQRREQHEQIGDAVASLQHPLAIRRRWLEVAPRARC